MPTEPTLLRYMTRFRCIAERCEDTCCTGLKVPVSEPQWARMRAAVAGSPEESERLHQCITPNPGGATAEHAFVQMRPDGHCPLLDTERLCSLQRRHGDAVLPDICATFPRVVTRWGERVEVSGTLACPEVARLCLLEEDAVEPVPTPLEASHVPRPETARHIPLDTQDAWAFHAETVREALLRLLHRREYPLPSRLAMLGHLAHGLDGFYFRGTEAFRGDDREAAEARLGEVLQRFESPDVREAVHRDFMGLALPGGPCVGLFSSVLRARMAAGRGERFSTLARGVLESLGLQEGAPGDLDAAWRTYAERWRRLEALHGARVHQYFDNYATHFLWRSPLIDAPSLLAYVFRLALRVGLLRLTLVGHPRVAELCQEPSPTAESREQLDRAAVETFQLVAKHVEQAPDFLALGEGLVGAGRGADTLGKVLVFATF
ncbi:lysine-N-methylase [Archangium gephyra]|uniref:Lysine-N-methylase n=1 Tax=Archangium gephyra TaxID=48 RepID=A0AAC8QFE3_9BACT|nr:flagellin lysine-N-methylase [Archangium gephyra]AKJ06445.1 Lysine-N-methylase [Archangium gephyra]REG32243.1 lysine-N-methylase [Archangium gephyra]